MSSALARVIMVSQGPGRGIEPDPHVIRGPRASPRLVPRIGQLGRAAALIVVFGSFATLGACADQLTAQSGSTAPPGEKADIVDGGGHLDEIYRQIYTPRQSHMVSVLVANAKS